MCHVDAAARTLDGGAGATLPPRLGAAYTKEGDRAAR
eukprot:gene26056-36336_t